MANRITFQFEDDLDYQMQAIHSTVELFREEMILAEIVNQFH